MESQNISSNHQGGQKTSPTTYALPEIPSAHQFGRHNLANGPLQCTITTSSSRKAHLLTSSDHLTNHAAAAKQLPFQCSMCSKAFTFKYPLQVHLRTHKGDKMSVHRPRGKQRRSSSLPPSSSPVATFIPEDHQRQTVSEDERCNHFSTMNGELEKGEEGNKTAKLKKLVPMSPPPPPSPSPSSSSFSPKLKRTYPSLINESFPHFNEECQQLDSSLKCSKCKLKIVFSNSLLESQLHYRQFKNNKCGYCQEDEMSPPASPTLTTSIEKVSDGDDDDAEETEEVPMKEEEIKPKRMKKEDHLIFSTKENGQKETDRMVKENVELKQSAFITGQMGPLLGSLPTFSFPMMPSLSRPFCTSVKVSCHEEPENLNFNLSNLSPFVGESQVASAAARPVSLNQHSSSHSSVTEKYVPARRCTLSAPNYKVNRKSRPADVFGITPRQFWQCKLKGKLSSKVEKTTKCRCGCCKLKALKFTDECPQRMAESVVYKFVPIKARTEEVEVEVEDDEVIVEDISDQSLSESLLSTSKNMAVNEQFYRCTENSRTAICASGCVEYFADRQQIMSHMALTRHIIWYDEEMEMREDETEDEQSEQNEQPLNAAEVSGGDAEKEETAFSLPALPAPLSTTIESKSVEPESNCSQEVLPQETKMIATEIITDQTSIANCQSLTTIELIQSDASITLQSTGNDTALPVWLPMTPDPTPCNSDNSAYSQEECSPLETEVTVNHASTSADYSQNLASTESFINSHSTTAESTREEAVISPLPQPTSETRNEISALIESLGLSALITPESTAEEVARLFPLSLPPPLATTTTELTPAESVCTCPQESPPCQNGINTHQTFSMTNGSQSLVPLESLESDYLMTAEEEAALSAAPSLLTELTPVRFESICSQPTLIPQSHQIEMMSTEGEGNLTNQAPPLTNGTHSLAIDSTESANHANHVNGITTDQSSAEVAATIDAALWLNVDFTLFSEEYMKKFLLEYTGRQYISIARSTIHYQRDGNSTLHIAENKNLS